LRIIHLTRIDNSRSNGPTQSVEQLSAHLNLLPGIDSEVVSVITASPGGHVRGSLVWQRVCHAERLAGDSSKDDLLVVFHGLWDARYWHVAEELKTVKIPYIITPRASLMRAALKKSFLRKLRGSLGAYRFISGAAALHFLTPEEKENSVSFGLPSFVISNGITTDQFDGVQTIDSPDTKLAGDDNGAIKRLVGGANYLLFLGRLDIYHKGLDLLVKAVSLNKAVFRNFGYKVLLVGDDTASSGQRLKRMVQQERIDDVIYVHANRVIGPTKLWLFHSTRGFLHTSRYEGEPQAVMEALYCHIPVLVTKGTNLCRFVSSNRLGLVADQRPRLLANGLEQFIRGIESGKYRTQGDWSVLSERSWEKVARKTCGLYSHVVSQAIAISAAKTE